MPCANTLLLPCLVRRPSRVVCLAFTVLAAACRSSVPSSSAAASPAVTADTWAVVDGREIRREDVERAFRRLGQQTNLSEEEAMTAKLSVLNDYIVQDILIAKAPALKVELPNADLDTAYANAKKNIPDDAFTQELSRRNLTAADMREGLRRELLAQKVIDHEVGSKIAVSDKEITDFFTANRAQFNLPEEAYHIAQIVITPVREPQIANQRGDDATTPQAAAAKAQMLVERLKSGEPFGDLAREFSEDPETAPRGGDLGFVPLSALKQAPPQLRDAVLALTPGSVRVVSQGGAHTIVLLVAHEQAGQRDLSMPAVKDGITNTLKGRKEQLLRTAYLTSIRSDAKVVNYLARRLVEAQGKMPSLAPIAPTAGAPAAKP
jgi:peptidyl-prolyl cis-trans isomerase SurA